ncbi:MAG: alkaline phosphatase family protein [Acidobacteria bacterium]|nr:alkaline phosphatase family protein [Acidobacteriota bacterium]
MSKELLTRNFLKQFLIPSCIVGALGFPALHAQGNPGTPATPIQHVVVIFQENVSFDHYFGTYPKAANSTPGEPAFHAAAGSPSVNGLNTPLLMHNPNLAAPFRLTRAQAVTCDQDHGYAHEQAAFHGGLMDLFVQSVGSSSSNCDVGGYGNKIVMGYYDGNTVTAMWNYAQNFAMSDNSFGTTFGPSTPGALNLVSGQTHGATVVSGNAAGNVSAGSVIGDPRPPVALDDCTIASKTQISMSGKNVGDLLNAKGITWGWFQGGFAPSSRKADGTAVCAATHNNISGASAGTDYIPHHEPFQYYAQTANPHHLPASSIAAIGTTDQANHQYDLNDFFTALKAGKMPAVSYLKAAAYQDGHAGYSDPLDEQTFLVNTINTIMQSPFWNSTAIVISYDDSDGWYDHVMGPVVNQSGTADDNLNGPGACGTGLNSTYQGRCGYGPRLPLMVISPYARTNYVDHNVTDQSSILRFIEDNWNLGRIGDASTDAYAGSLMTFFDFAHDGGGKRLLLDPATGNPVGGDERETGDR